MIALLSALLALCAGGNGTCLPRAAEGGPATLIVATTRGESIIPVSTERGDPALPVPYLGTVLPLTSEIKPDWAVVTFAGQPFRFLLNAPVLVHDSRVIPLVSGAYVLRDTLFIPLQWLTGYVPAVFTEGYRYDALAGRFEEAVITPVVKRTPAPKAVAARRVSRLPPSGVLRFPHKIVVDAGHGGIDPGNPGIFFPRDVHEKDVTLAIAKLLRKELEDRGIEVIMTRTTDTLIALGDRGDFCRDDCDLFVSIHVNSLPRRRGYQQVSGVETYFQAVARTEESRRVQEMENDALRYDTHYEFGAENDPLGFILKDLQSNEFLRESAILAQLIQQQAGRSHPGGDRGVSQAGFVVLKTARRPAVLVETGFSTNPGDGKFLASRAGQLKVARSIADGVVAYLRQYENKVAFEAEP